MHTPEGTPPEAPTRRRATQETRRSSSTRKPQAIRVCSGRFLSALVVVGCALGTVVASTQYGFHWSLTALVCFSGVLLAFGWPALSSTPVQLPGQLGIIMVSSTTTLAVAVSHDMWGATETLGISLLILIGIEVLTSSRPRDYSEHEDKQTREHSEPHARRRVGTKMGETGQSHWGARSTTASIASSLTAALLASSGAAWIHLAVTPQWSSLVPVAAIVVACAVLADQIGSSYRLQSVVAVFVAVSAGTLAAWGLWTWGRTMHALPVLLPSLSGDTPSVGAALLLGALAGVAVGLIVVVVDGLVGAHGGPLPLQAHAARGAAKFLVAALPLYVLVRVGEL